MKKMPNLRQPRTGACAGSLEARRSDHCADSDKDEYWEHFIDIARVIEYLQYTGDTFMFPDSGKRQVDENSAKADRQKKHWLIILFNSQKDQNNSDRVHDESLVIQLKYARKQFAKIFQVFSLLKLMDVRYSRKEKRALT